MKEMKEPICWIVGGCDSYGNVTAHEYRLTDPDQSNGCHTPTENKGYSFRWKPDDKTFENHFRPQEKATPEQAEAIQNYLVRKGYANDRDFERMEG